jgi:hypothetical protein
VTNVIAVLMHFIVFPTVKHVIVVLMDQFMMMTSMPIVMKMENVHVLIATWETNVTPVLLDITMSITIATHAVVMLKVLRVYNVVNLEYAHVNPISLVTNVIKLFLDGMILKIQKNATAMK